MKNEEPVQITAQQALRWKKDMAAFINEAIFQGKFCLTPYQEEWAKHIQKYRRLSFMAFRSSGKSEFFFVCYPLWKAITTPGWQGLLISNSEEQAKNLIKRMKAYVQSNPILKTAMPKSRVEAWSKTELTLNNGSWIGSKPYNENIRGYHVDFVGLDEVGTYRDHSIFKEAVIPTVRAKGGTIVCIGTPESEIDLLHKIERDDDFKSFYTDRFPAECDEKGELFKIRYPKSKIIHEGAIVKIYEDDLLVDTFSSLTWSKEFLLRPLGDGDMLFPPAMIRKFLDEEHEFVYSAQQFCDYYMGVDFALSGKSQADSTVITVAQKNRKEDFYRIVNIEKRTGMDYSMQKRLISEMAEAYKPRKILVDKSNFGEPFLQDLRSQGLPIEGYSFGGSSRTLLTQAKKEIIVKLREELDKENIIFNYGRDIRTRQMVDELVAELSKFAVVVDKYGVVKFQGKGSHDDMVISLALVAFATSGRVKASFKVFRGGRSSGRGFLSRLV